MLIPPRCLILHLFNSARVFQRVVSETRPHPLLAKQLPGLYNLFFGSTLLD